MPTKSQWLVLLAVLNAMTLVGGWGFTRWSDQLSTNPALVVGWMATCAMAAIIGSVGFAVLLTLSHKIR